MSGPILPGATLGVLGGGQLGRMFALAARRMGYHINVLVPGIDTPTGEVSSLEIDASYDDLDAVRQFARNVKVVTFEFENIPAATAAAAAEHAPVRPAGSLLHMTQHRRREKEGLRSAGVPTVRWATVDTEGDLDRAVETVGVPAILKTAAWGYDGKGQIRIDRHSDATAAWDALHRAPAVYEAVAEFEREISVIGVRGLDGSVALYEPIENLHVRHILDLSISPAAVAPRVADRAKEIVRTLLGVWEVVGVVCVEMFLLTDGELLVNEVAPRPHNSGHLTIDAHVCSQFEQQVRAVCGLPLGSPRQVMPAVMANLLGDLWTEGTPDWPAALTSPGVALHMYSKDEARPGRKMGHITAIAPTTDDARRLADAARSALTTRRGAP